MGYRYFQIDFCRLKSSVQSFWQIFHVICLFFLANFPGPTFIPCPTSNPDSRIVDSKKVWSFENFENYLILCIIRICFFMLILSLYRAKYRIILVLKNLNKFYFLFSAICNDNAVEFEVLDQIAELEEILTLNMISAKVPFIYYVSSL